MVAGGDQVRAGQQSGGPQTLFRKFLQFAPGQLVLGIGAAVAQSFARIGIGVADLRSVDRCTD